MPQSVNAELRVIITLQFSTNLAVLWLELILFTRASKKIDDGVS